MKKIEAEAKAKKAPKPVEAVVEEDPMDMLPPELRGLMGQKKSAAQTKSKDYDESISIGGMQFNLENAEDTDDMADIQL